MAGIQTRGTLTPTDVADLAAWRTGLLTEVGQRLQLPPGWEVVDFVERSGTGRKPTTYELCLRQRGVALVEWVSLGTLHQVMSYSTRTRAALWRVLRFAPRVTRDEWHDVMDLLGDVLAFDVRGEATG